MITFDQIDRKLNLFVNDVEASTEDEPARFSLPLRVEAWNWAQRQLCAHTPRQIEMELTVNSGNRSAVLPSDYFCADRIYDSARSMWWRPMRRRPGDIRYENDDIPEFWTWGGKMMFEDSIDYDSGQLTLYYWAYYPDIELDPGRDEVVYRQAQVFTPRQFESALLHLTAAFCWTPGAAEAFDLNEWKITIDSGTPIHNPRAMGAREHLFWYNTLMDSFPPARTETIE